MPANQRELATKLRGKPEDPQEGGQGISASPADEGPYAGSLYRICPMLAIKIEGISNLSSAVATALSPVVEMYQNLSGYTLWELQDATNKGVQLRASKPGPGNESSWDLILTVPRKSIQAAKDAAPWQKIRERHIQVLGKSVSWW